MSPIISQPNALANGTPADGSEVYENIQTAVDLLNGNIDADNVSPTAALPGTVISTTSPVPTNRIADDAVTADKLKDDSSGAAGAVTTDHIRSLAVTKAKVAAGTLTLAQMDIQLQTAAFSLGGTVAQNHLTVQRRTVTGNYEFTVVNHVGSTTTAHVLPALGTPIPTATRQVIAAYIADVVPGVTTTGTLVVVSAAIS